MGRIEKYEIALTNDQNEVYEEAMASLKKYNQAAIHLYTSGGKSYILGKILERLDDNKLRTSPSGDRLSVLYCSKNGCCENAKRLFGGHSWENVIQYITFCTLQHDTKAVDSLNVGNFDVIVIDEAHRALAKQTYKGINYILSKYPRASVIAMSANNKRNDDRKWVFEWLTPKLKIGVDYQNRGIKWAVQNNKICSYVYRNGDLDKLKRYTTLLTNIKDRESLNDYSELLNESMELLKKFSNNPFEIVEEQLKHDIDSIGYDGTNGDRWIVFFNRIDDIEKSADKIKGLFDKAYDGKGCNINIIKFHSKSTNEQEALEALTQKSVDKQVDVVLTCMKASSSFHPDNIRGIIVNRHSNSEIDVTQMFGRALQIKELCSDNKIIYDIVGNELSNDIMQSRVSNEQDIEDDLLKLKSESKIENQLYKLGGEATDSGSINDRLDNLLDEFAEIAEHLECLLQAKKLGNILKEKQLELNESNVHPYITLREYDDNNGTNYVAVFSELQNKFLHGYFGEQGSSEFNEVYEQLGNSLYMTDLVGSETEYTLTDLIKIADEIESYDGNYTGRISHTVGLKENINKLRTLYLDNKLCEPFIIFCKRNNIDIEGKYCDLGKLLTDKNISETNIDMHNEFKSLCRKATKLSNILNSHDDSILNNKEFTKHIISLIIKIDMFTCKYVNRDLGRQLSNALRIKFKDVINVGKNLVGAEEYIDGHRLIQAIIRIKAKCPDEKSTSLNDCVSSDIEQIIFRLGIQMDSNKLSDYNKAILFESSNSRRYNLVIQDLLSRTPFSILYRQFIQNQQQYLFDRLMGYSPDELPDYNSKMLRTRAFTSSRTQFKQQGILKKDNDTVKDIIKQLYYDNEEDIKKLNNAVKKCSIDKRKFFIYAMPNKKYINNKGFIDRIASANWEDLTDRDKMLINIIIKTDVYIYEDIFSILLKHDLIADNQIKLVEYILN